VALIVGVISSMMVLLFYHHLRGEKRYDAGIKLRRDMESAINLVLADTAILVGERDDSIDLFGKGSDSVFIKEENWGLSGVACITVVENAMRLRKDFLYGAQPDGFLSGCLYLTDHQSPLSLSGDAKLEGDAWLSKGGLKPVFIDQSGFSYDELIKGNIKRSLDSLPAVDKRIIESITSYNKKRTVETGIPDSLEQSFSDSVVVLYQKGPLSLAHCQLKGHVLIISDSSINVKNTCLLKNVLLSAPEIEFESGCSGIVQAMATDSIVVHGGCNFSYPSSLVVVKKDSSLLQPEIIIGDSCLFSGVILTEVLKKDENKTFVGIGKNSAITGLIYCAGYLSLKGKVTGTVLTDYFIYRSLPSIYINYLVDAELNRSGLSGYYVIPNLFFNKKPNKIMQWVN